MDADWSGKGTCAAATATTATAAAAGIVVVAAATAPAAETSLLLLLFLSLLVSLPACKPAAADVSCSALSEFTCPVSSLYVYMYVCI